MASTKKTKWFDISKILSTDSDFMLIVGQRGNGKTFSAMLTCLEDYKKTRRRFCYVRRWKEDLLNGRAETLLMPLSEKIEKLFGKGYFVLYQRRRYYLCNPDGEKLDIIGYAVSLSEASHTKSQTFVDVRYIVFDEFIQMAGEPTLRDEMSKFENTLSSIIRTRQDCKILMLANTVSRFSQYFIHFGIDINKVEQGQIITKEYPLDDDKGVLRISLEYCEYNADIGKKTSKYTQSKMISKGQWEIPETSDIPSVVGETVNDKLLCSMYDPDSDQIIGMFLRHSRWYDIVNDPETFLFHQEEHHREFLIIKTIDYKSSYFHLTDQKSLTYTMYNDISYFLSDILDSTDINIEHELFMGRIFSDNMFTADTFNHIWSYYGNIPPRKLL